MEVITHKRCSACKVLLEVQCFPLDSSTPDGYRYQCRECKRAQDRASQQRRAANGHKRRIGKAPPVPAWPIPTFTIQESLDCVRLKKWRGPVSNEPMRARL